MTERVTATLGGRTFARSGYWLDPADGVGAVLSKEIEGWDSTSIRGEVTEWPDRDGGRAAPAYFESRNLVLEGFMNIPSFVSGVAVRDRFVDSLPNKVFAPFVVTEGSLTRYVMARVQGKPSVVWDGEDTIEVSVQLIATDHRRFAGTGPESFSDSGVARLPIADGGLAIPSPASGLTVPFAIPATVTNNVVKVGSNGTGTPRVVVTIQAVNSQLTNPQIMDELGNRMTFNLVLTVGQSLVIDLDKRTILLNGTASRRSALRGSWINPRPGMSLTFNAEGFLSTNQATATVAWTDTWN